MDVESARNSLRGTLKSLQVSVFYRASFHFIALNCDLLVSSFLIFNSFIRASRIARERVLKYFSTVLSLNVNELACK